MAVEYQTYLDIVIFIIPIIILIGVFLVPSKRRIIERGIEYVHPMALKAQYILGGLSIAFGIGLLVFYFGDTNVWLNLLNGIILIPLGGILIFNSFSTSKTLAENSDGELGAVVMAEEEEEVQVAEMAPKKKAKPKEVTIECPGCNSQLKITMTSSPMMMTCPVCGTEGEIS